MKTELLHKTIETLISYNIWRRSSDDVTMTDQKELGDALDHATSVLMQVENMINHSEWHNFEIAYRGLELAAGAI